MYTIKQAAARSGLTVPTVRVWERRYGIVHPERTTTGYRLYDEDAIARLLAMRYLVDGRGMRPSQAAEHVISDSTGLEALIGDARAWARAGGEMPGAVADRAPVGAHDAVADFVGAARRLDLHAMDRALDEAFASERFEAAMDHVVFPALRAIGDGWVDGSIDVAMEHAASEVIRRRLARFHDATAVGARQPDAVVGLPPGSHHDIGVLAFAVAARRAGVAVLYLGANVPIESWVRAIATTGARIAVVGAVTEIDIDPAGRVLAALRAMPDPPDILLGGNAAGTVEGARAGDILPDRIDDAVAVVGRLVTVAP